MAERLTVLRKRPEFLAANKGLRNARPGFVLLTIGNAGQGKRFGVTVTKKIGNAVVRNRMKRRFRELLRAALPAEGLADTDHVLIGREGGIERDFARMREALSAALARARDGKGDPARRRKDPSRNGEGDHAKHGGGARAPKRDGNGRDKPRVPLHHPAGGSPPPVGEE
jgi:ribonuclease P protein component